MHLTVERQHIFPALLVILLGALVIWRAPWSTDAAAAGEQARLTNSNVAIDCGPGQQALVRQTVVNRESQVSVACATVTGAQDAMVGLDQYGRPMRNLQPVAYATPAVLSPRTAALTAPAAAPAPARVARTSATRARTAETSGRSWKKSALIIGGSAGTGAGVGAMIGGKKGALIGTALGGGTAALYEAIKR